MRIAITGGTGFVGGHLAHALSADGHEAVVLARGIDDRPWARQVRHLAGVTFVEAGLGDEEALIRAFEGCEAVAHCAGINREVGPQTYDAVHVRGTANVVRAATRADVGRLAFLSFMRARPDCGSAYHESKWEAEEIVRASDRDWTVLKPGMMFGLGDHMLDHLSHALHTFPIFVGIGSCRVRPLAVEDAVKVLVAATVDGRLADTTVALVGSTDRLRRRCPPRGRGDRQTTSLRPGPHVLPLGDRLPGRTVDDGSPALARPGEDPPRGGRRGGARSGPLAGRPGPPDALRCRIDSLGVARARALPPRRSLVVRLTASAVSAEGQPRPSWRLQDGQAPQPCSACSATAASSWTSGAFS